MATNLILIRHGQTLWNFKRIYCGFKDIGLSNIGKKQAKSLQKRLSRETIHKVYSSDKKRAVQTAEIIFQRWPIEKVADLSEMNFGCFEGLTHTQITKIYPEVYRKWLKNPFAAVVPGGERMANFKKRVASSFKKILFKNKGKTVAVVCHGGVISIFLAGILKGSNFWGLIPKAASISIVEYANRKFRIKLFNDTVHLNG